MALLKKIFSEEKRMNTYSNVVRFIVKEGHEEKFLEGQDLL